MAAIKAAPMSVPVERKVKVRKHISVKDIHEYDHSYKTHLPPETEDLPITAPALAPGLRDLTAE
jgi:hypothetical protein